jgi:hypothetical protein
MAAAIAAGHSTGEAAATMAVQSFAATWVS